MSFYPYHSCNFVVSRICFSTLDKCVLFFVRLHKDVQHRFVIGQQGPMVAVNNGKQTLALSLFISSLPVMAIISYSFNLEGCINGRCAKMIE